MGLTLCNAYVLMSSPGMQVGFHLSAVLALRVISGALVCLCFLFTRLFFLSVYSDR